MHYLLCFQPAIQDYNNRLYILHNALLDTQIAMVRTSYRQRFLGFCHWSVWSKSMILPFRPNPITLAFNRNIKFLSHIFLFVNTEIHTRRAAVFKDHIAGQLNTKEKTHFIFASLKIRALKTNVHRSYLKCFKWDMFLHPKASNFIMINKIKIYLFSYLLSKVLIRSYLYKWSIYYKID